jgi:hypothetical protein
VRGIILFIAFVSATLLVAWTGIGAQTTGLTLDSDGGVPKELQLPKDLRWPKGLPLPKGLDGGRPQFPELDLEQMPFPEGGTLIEHALNRLKIRQRTFEPAQAINSLNVQILDFDRRCATQPAACRHRDELQTVQAIIRQGARDAPGCDAAADAFKLHLDDLLPPEAIARAFDLACLGSLLQRASASGPEPLRPSILGTGGAPGGPQGALTVIGLIEVKGVPFCGALLRNDRTLATARHCYHDIYPYLPAGEVTVRPLSGSGGPWKIGLEPVDAAPESDETVEGDWIRLRIETADAIGAAEVTMVAQPPIGPVTLVGHFAPYRHASGPIAIPSEWRRGLRFPRAGLCVTVSSSPRCVQIACQTVKGFSGTPIFQVDPARPDAPLHVVGLVSRPQQLAAGCGMDGVFYTLAVPARAIR